ncbi:polysaccharide biosynthesis protein [Puteibacter caeruleilacunae]|nr:polysaccharide biosynthesis protein [Puteibacter caeruleilacunae]
MKKQLSKLANRHIVSPWWILVIDLMLTSGGFLAAYIIRMNYSLVDLSAWEVMKTGGLAVSVYGLCYLLFKSFRGVIRQTDVQELGRILLATSTASVLLFVQNYSNDVFNFGWPVVPRLAIIVSFIINLILLSGFRLVVRQAYQFLTVTKPSRKAYVYGAGDLGLLALKALEKERADRVKVVGFIDDDARKCKTLLRDIPVCNFEKAMSKAEENGVDMVVLAIANLPKRKIRKITEYCLEHDVEVKVLPAFENWMQQKEAERNIRNLKIEDLLGRDQIQLDLDRIKAGLKDKVVLVSGAAGSIGSEIVRQLVKYPLKRLILLDQAESALYDLQQELIANGVPDFYELVVADVSNLERMEKMFQYFDPQVVFNAAAYKHVPLMEINPYEAMNVNVRGAKNLADLSIKYGVKKFVMVSTDKAVNPTNVMGASKRLCEIYIQALAQKKETKTSFITTRFGNVLGSNGSVVPLFRKQIEKGGPITVTHPDITRYFMTIPEACQLVLEAGFMGQGGEIFVFDMGQPVKIADLAKRMIKLSGLKLGEDIEIKYSGLRPGEKLYEELLATKENTMPTHNSKIMIGKVRKHDFDYVNGKITELLDNLDTERSMEMVRRIKELVPEFVSKNSKYEVLDHDAADIIATIEVEKMELSEN